MRQFSAAILILLVLCASLKDNLSFVMFKVNQGYIAEFLCINKDKPEMQCSGKCHLNDMIAENQETERSDNQMPVPTEERPLLVCVELDDLIDNENDALSQTPAMKNDDIPLPAHTFDIFHPPRMLL